MAEPRGRKSDGDDFVAELKSIRKRRVELAGETSKLEEKLREIKLREAQMQETEHAKRALEAETRLLESEEKRARDLAEQLKREQGAGLPQKPASPGKDEGEARTVEIGAKSVKEELDSSYPYSFLIAKRFFGVEEFAKAEARDKDVVSKTKKLVGM